MCPWPVALPLELACFQPHPFSTPCTLLCAICPFFLPPVAGRTLWPLKPPPRGSEEPPPPHSWSPPRGHFSDADSSYESPLQNSFLETRGEEGVDEMPRKCFWEIQAVPAGSSSLPGQGCSGLKKAA